MTEDPLKRAIARQHVLDSTRYQYPWSGVANTSRDGGWWWRCTCNATSGSYSTQELAEGAHPRHRDAALEGARLHPWLTRGDLVEVLAENADGGLSEFVAEVAFVTPGRVFFLPTAATSTRLEWVTKVNGIPLGDLVEAR